MLATWLAWLLLASLLHLTSTTPAFCHAASVTALTHHPLDPASIFPSQLHPLTPAIDTSELSTASWPLHTHKFYTNLLLEDGQALPIYPNPYILQFTTADKLQPYSGASVSCNKQRVTGGKGLTPEAVGFEMNAVSTNLGFSSVEFSEQHAAPHRSLMAADAFGATVRLYADKGHRDSQYVDFSMTYGMVYVTAVYNTLTPLLWSVAAIVKIDDEPVAADKLYTADDDTHRLSVELNNGQLWYIYVILDSKSESVEFKHTLTAAGSQLVGSSPFTGTVRAAKVPTEYEQDDLDAMTTALDEHCNVVPTGGQLAELSVDSNEVQYRIEWHTTNIDEASDNTALLHYALPHHVQSLDTRDDLYTIDAMQLQSTTTGMMTAVVGNEWQLTEATPPPVMYDLPTLYPMNADTLKQYDDDVLQTLVQSTISDINDFDLKQTLQIESNYYIGKFAVKLGQLCGVATNLIKVLDANDVSDELYNARNSCVDQLETLMTAFINGEWPNSVVFDSSHNWSLIVGHLGLKDQSDYIRGIDFFGSYGNDQHYHYGYILHAVNILVELRPQWLTQKVIDIMTTIIRSTVNPSREDDKYFPQLRIFDLYSGHAWSSGLVASADGHDEESTSEAALFYQAVLKFGQLSKQPAVRDIGTLLLAVTAHTIPLYQLYTSDNTVMPPEITANKVSGIIFENKVAPEATWFDPSAAAIHGIQMLPFIVTTPLIRSTKFVTEEWKAILPSIQPTLDDSTIAWNSILWVNYCQVDSREGIKHLLEDDLTYDNGLSPAYALYWCMTIDNLAQQMSNDDGVTEVTVADKHAIRSTAPSILHIKKSRADHTTVVTVMSIAVLLSCSSMVLCMLWHSNALKRRIDQLLHRHDSLSGRQNERQPLLAG